MRGHLEPQYTGWGLSPPGRGRDHTSSPGILLQAEGAGPQGLRTRPPGPSRDQKRSLGPPPRPEKGHPPPPRTWRFWGIAPPETPQKGASISGFPGSMPLSSEEPESANSLNYKESGELGCASEGSGGEKYAPNPAHKMPFSRWESVRMPSGCPSRSTRHVVLGAEDDSIHSVRNGRDKPLWLRDIVLHQNLHTSPGRVRSGC
jgi:hypothetical protein